MSYEILTSSLVYTRSQLEKLYLPGGQMLQIDRVISADAGQIVCEMDVAEHWAFPLHFPCDPIFPGTLLIEAAGQAIAIWGWHQGLRGRPRLIKTSAHFEKPILPEHETVTLVSSVKLRHKNICIGTIKVYAGQNQVAEIEVTLIIIAQLDLALAEEPLASPRTTN